MGRGERVELVNGSTPAKKLFEDPAGEEQSFFHSKEGMRYVSDTLAIFDTLAKAVEQPCQ
jgi:hypothetical protein